MQVYYQNIRGANTKASRIRPNIVACTYDIVAFAETWTQVGFNTAELFPQSHIPRANFNVYRGDRDLNSTGKQTGGGVVIGVRTIYESEIMYLLENQGLELIWILGRSCTAT